MCGAGGGVVVRAATGRRGRRPSMPQSSAARRGRPLPQEVSPTHRHGARAVVPRERVPGDAWRCHVGDGARRPRPQHYVSEHPVRCCPRAHPGPRPSPRHARGCPSCFFEARRAHTFFLTGFVSVSAMVSVGERTGLREGHGGQGSARTSAYGRGSPRPRGRKTRARCLLSPFLVRRPQRRRPPREGPRERARQGPSPDPLPPLPPPATRRPPRAGEPPR